ncbi:MAG: hypothetical protein U0264_03340 [Candidatus Kapaibacterium sp.]
MKLEKLIPYLVNSEQLVQLYKELGLNSEPESLLMYMHGELDLKSEVVFFESEETQDYLIFIKNGKRYIQLFAIDHAMDLIEFDLDLKDKGYSNLMIAQRLIEYRINDA